MATPAAGASQPISQRLGWTFCYFAITFPLISTGKRFLGLLLASAVKDTPVESLVISCVTS